MLSARVKRIVKAVLPRIIADAVRPLRRGGTVSDERSYDLIDREFYKPEFSPWEGFGEFKAIIAAVSPHSLVPREGLWVLHTLAKQACHIPGNFWECGVYKGGTAIMLESVVSSAPGK